MSTVLAGFKRMDDHFHPADSEDPAAQRRRRGQMEAIDYTAYACNREVAANLIKRAERDGRR